MLWIIIFKEKSSLVLWQLLQTSIVYYRLSENEISTYNELIDFIIAANVNLKKNYNAINTTTF